MSRTRVFGPSFTAFAAPTLGRRPPLPFTIINNKHSQRAIHTHNSDIGVLKGAACNGVCIAAQFISSAIYRLSHRGMNKQRAGGVLFLDIA